MSWWSRLLPGSRRRDRDVDAEIEAHLELRARALVDAGMEPAAARREAERRFGDLDVERARLYASAARRDRRLRRAGRLDTLTADLRAAGRRLRHSPGASSLAVATFALGIGLTTATFSVVDHTLLRPLPFDEPDRLVALHSVPEEGPSFPYISATNWMDWEEQNRTLESTAIYSIFGSVTVATDDDAFTVPAKYVSAQFFDVLRTPLAAGRTPTPEEMREGERVAVVSEGFWRRVMGARADLPAELPMSSWTAHVIGVVEGGYGFPEGTDIWLPARYEYTGGAARNNINYYAIARLAEGVDVGAARADLSAIADRIRADDPAGIYSWGVGVLPLKEEIVGGAEQTLWLAMGCVLAVLLVSCANLAGLEFARRRARAHETALRVALGAGRWRVAQQGMVEQVVLALIGGALGAALAWTTTSALLSRYPLPVPRAEAVAVDLRVLVFAVVMSLGAGILASVIPSLVESRTRPARAMAGARTAARGGRNLPGAALVAAEVTVAVVLLVAGGLLARSFMALTSRDVGFNPNGVIGAEIALTPSVYREGQERRLAYWRAGMETLAGAPGVTAVAVGNPPPTYSGGRGFVTIEKRPEFEAGANYVAVSHDYFDVLQIRLLAGRLFGPQDGPATERVVIIDRTMAEAYWPDANPVGERIRAISQETYLDAPPLLIVGVVDDVLQYGFNSDPTTTMYVLHEQVPQHTNAMTLIARVATDPEALLRPLRDRLRQIDPGLAVDVTTMEARLGNRVAGERLLAATLAVFAALGLTLTAIGIYGLLSFAVGQRTREIAVRMAVGARGRDVVSMVTRNALLIVAVGLLTGLSLAFGFSHLIAALLVDVPARDPLTYFAASATVLLAALAAALVPALRAARKSPVEALRQG